MLKQIAFLFGFLVALIGVAIMTDPLMWTIESMATGLLLIVAGLSMIVSALADPPVHVKRT